MSIGFVGTRRNIPDPGIVSFRSFFVLIGFKSCHYSIVLAQYERGLCFFFPSTRLSVIVKADSR